MTGTGRGLVPRDGFPSSWPIWIIAGTFGCGVSYALLCYASLHAPGWIIAATWQMTILATPIILFLYGKRVPIRGLGFAAIVCAGVILVEVEHARSAIGYDAIWSVVSMMVLCAFLWPAGTQLVKE